MSNSFVEFEENGEKVGQLLNDGQVDKAHKEYDDLIRRIHDESRETDPRKVPREMADMNEQDRTYFLMDRLVYGMVQVDPDDVKSPENNGTDEGHYIYWNTENVVTQTNVLIKDFCRKYGDPEIPHQESALYTSAVTRQDIANNVKREEEKRLKQTELLAKTTDWLNTTVTDGLERHTFVADFNRRRPVTNIQAVMTDALEIQLVLKGPQ